MGLHIVTGAANAGKTGVLHDALRAASHSRKTATLLLPSSPDVVRARREMSADCALGLSVGGFDDFLDSLWAQLYDDRAIIGHTQRLLLLQKAVGETKFCHLSKSAQRPGFVRLMDGVVQRAAEADLLRAASPPGEGMADELFHVMAGYAKLLTRAGLIERAEAHNSAISRIRELRLPDVIAANRFGNLTPLQERFLCAAAPHSDVWIALTWDEGVAATASAGPLIDRLSRLGMLEQAPVYSPPEDAPAELTVLERSLFSPGVGRELDVVPVGAVILSEAWGSEAEAARITREIQDACAEGAAPGDIAVVFRDPLRHVDALRSAFSDAGIVAEYDLYVPAARTGLGRALGQALSFFCGGGSRRDLVGFLRTPFVPGGSDKLDEIDAYMRRDRVTDMRGLSSRAKGTEPKLAEVLSLVEHLCSSPVDVASLAKWRRLMAGMMANAYRPASDLGPEGRLDARVMRLISEATEEMASMDDLDFTAHDVLSLLNEASVAVSSEEHRDCVQVLGAERMRGRRFSRVILGGLTAGEFPSLPAENALSAPAILEGLASRGIDMSPRVDLDAERLLFYQVVTRARHRLVLSRCVSDADGHPVRPSPLLEEFLDLYRDPSVGDGAWYRGAPPVRVVTLSDMGATGDSPITPRRALREALGNNGNVMDNGGASRLVHARWRSRGRAVCLGEATIESLARRMVYSVSDIELYLTCPYRWYVDRVLAPDALDAELDAGAIGSAAHEIMCRFYERYEATTGEKRVTPASLRAAVAVHADVSSEVLASLRAVGVAEEIALRRVVRATRRMVEEDALLLEGFAPAAHEWSFGMGDDPPEDFGTFALRGRVDRIDAGVDGFVITDYKSGSVTGKQQAKFAAEGLVQLPLYAEVVRRRLGLGDPVAGFYRSILSTGKPRGFFCAGALDACQVTRTDACSPREVSGLIEDAISRASEAVEGMRSGRIEPASNARSCPSYCTARAYCGGRV
ncbi:MAG: PD-(D/E)XK nuclease family protein [Coriobacteriia bacterium]|nr:PD-(D/E)XK nuclease family protein [Coriobacteriia bacterium]